MNSYNINGVNKTLETKDVEELCIKSVYNANEVAFRNHTLLEEEFKYDLTHKLIKVVKEHVVFQKDYNRMGDICLSARINICKPGVKFNLIEDDVYIIDNKTFTKTQIEHALKTVYASDFI